MTEGNPRSAGTITSMNRSASRPLTRRREAGAPLREWYDKLTEPTVSSICGQRSAVLQRNLPGRRPRLGRDDGGDATGDRRPQ
jgi:hypothetical protein